MNRLWRDTDGSSLVEFTLVFFPVVALVTFGTVDFGYLIFESALANKAAYVGARRAVVSSPVATEITDLTYTTAGTNMGDPCFNPATGVAANGCPTVSTVCTPATSGGSCTGGYTWNEDAFTRIFDRMRDIFPPGKLQRQNVRIAYETTGLGFVGRPNGLPMSVTVSIECMTHQFFFIDRLKGWAFGVPAGCPGTPAGKLIPNSATTLTSEDMSHVAGEPGN